METSIAAMATGMAMANLQNSVSISMMKKSLEATQQNMEAITQMMDSMPSPDGRGTVLDIRV
ncbi:MAG: YjfB family protein [Oscillospiraceae bacterium]|nr:YjfB family protein [Oscillospiraceae bacterium]